MGFIQKMSRRRPSAAIFVHIFVILLQGLLQGFAIFFL